MSKYAISELKLGWEGGIFFSWSAATTSSLQIQFEKNYPRCNSDDIMMGHIKINNNIPVSPDKWIDEQEINPNIALLGTFLIYK